ncbi:MAG: hypothetical protein KA258_07565 [Deltaproteobacteria bacterium]|jgi:hypothetical protein|nr:hypothetical protein [Deltaproteobacteria bacterium]
MRVIAVRWAELETAVERNAPDTESFLDTRSGEVITLVESAPSVEELRSRVMGGGDAYLRVEPASSREQYKWMERFVAGVTEPVLRERLIISIDGKGAFRRFKDALLNYPVERERWFAYRGELLHWHIQEWFKRDGLTTVEPPPWGEVQAPIESDVQLPRPVTNGDAPGDGYRRSARDLIEQLPAAELPSAIAFLEFLRDRGSGDLLRARPPSGGRPKQPIPGA